MKSAVVFSLIGIGVLLLIGSGVFSTLQPGTSAWTTEKDQRLSQASDKMHLLTAQVTSAEARPKMHGGPDIAKAKVELEALRAETKTLMDEFKGIQARPNKMAKFMKWAGISLTLVGIVGWYAVNQSR
jgi:hypothetical protein